MKRHPPEYFIGKPSSIVLAWETGFRSRRIPPEAERTTFAGRAQLDGRNFRIEVDSAKTEQGTLRGAVLRDYAHAMRRNELARLRALFARRGFELI